nr:copia protein [Tanacetum cinerariifolium]
TKTINYQLVTAGNQSNPSVSVQEQFDVEKAGEENVQQYVLFPLWSSNSTNPQNTNDAAFGGKKPEFKGKKPESKVYVSPSSSGQTKKHDDKTKREAKEDVGAEADFTNLETNITVSLIPTTRVHKDHHVTQIIGDLSSATQTRNMTRLLQDQGHTQEEGIDYEEVFAPLARIEAIQLFLAYASFMRFMVYQMDVKSAFLYGTIEKELLLSVQVVSVVQIVTTVSIKVSTVMYRLRLLVSAA